MFYKILRILSSLSNNDNDFTKNDFNLGKWSKPLNIISVIFLIIVNIILFLPNQFT